jgi:hypothetical protein
MTGFISCCTKAPILVASRFKYVPCIIHAATLQEQYNDPILAGWCKGACRSNAGFALSILAMWRRVDRYEQDLRENIYSMI